MFCPKCGTKNPSDGKFCRKCGTDLVPVSEVLTGGSSNYTGDKKKRKEKKKYSWESAMGKLFTGIAFLAVAAILGITGVAGGHFWWFWMLIPAFSMLGTGVAEVLQITHGNQPGLDTPSNIQSNTHQVSGSTEKALPPTQTEYVSPEKSERFETGELVPPSVVENTTRHLELDKEGKTMTLPERD